MSDRQPEPKRLRGNELLRLDDPAAAWRIERGSIALFGVPLHGGTPHGPRRFLFSVRAGETLFGLPEIREADRFAVVGVALEESSLLPVAAAGADAAESIRRWKESWRSCVVRFEPPSPAGAAPAEISLRDYHAALLVRIHELGLRWAEEERTRIRGRERRSGEVTSRALAQLTSILGSRREAAPQGTELFVAASLVGQSAGIRMRRPPAWLRGEGATERVEAIAQASRVRARKVVLHDGWWKQDCGPLLAFRGAEQRPVALLARPGGGYRMVDPATRARAAVEPRIAGELAPEAWVFYRPLPENATRATALLRFALRGRSRDLAVILATAALATVLGMFTPQATALLVDHAIPDANLSLLGQIGLGLLAAALGIAVFRWSQGIAMMRVETGADVATQSAVWDRLLNLQVAFFRDFSTGDLQSRVTAVSQIRSYLGGTTLRTLFSSVILLLNLALLLYYSPALTLLALGVAVLSGAVTVISGLAILRYTRVILELKGRFFGFMVQLVHGVAKLRVAAAEERAFSRWARDYARLLELELSQRRIQDAVRAINLALTALSAILLFSFAATLIQGAGPEGGLSTGVFLAFSVAYGTFIGAVSGLSNTVSSVMAIAILRERARPILEASPEVGERRADPGPLRGGLELDHVSFRYREDGPTILHDVSLSVEPGQFAALVGPSGSGKSTLLRLLLGFESPAAGSVYFDGQDIAGLDVRAVRRQMGVVLQNGRINAGSVYENIVTGTQLSLNDAWEAARAAGFAGEIEAMPMGMHTIISEGGTNLSGGQRQRMLLTRALVHRPKILLLDEATSALDNQTQAIVSDSLSRLDVTRVVIAHRLSTVRDADRIYVVQAGRIVEQGSFEELAGQGGLFSRLMARQMA